MMVVRVVVSRQAPSRRSRAKRIGELDSSDTDVEILPGFEPHRRLFPRFVRVQGGGCAGHVLFDIGSRAEESQGCR